MLGKGRWDSISKMYLLAERVVGGLTKEALTPQASPHEKLALAPPIGQLLEISHVCEEFTDPRVFLWGF